MCYNELYFEQGFISGLAFVFGLFVLSVALKYLILYLKALIEYLKDKKAIQKEIDKRFTVIIVDGKIVKIFEEEEKKKWKQ